MSDHKTGAAVSSSELVSLVEQALHCLTGACTGKQYDPSWIRPRTMNRQEIQTACEQAYHWMYKVKEALEVNAEWSDGANERLARTNGYLPGVEIYEGYARVNPHNCAIKERTGDGVPVGPCCFYLTNGTTCPRHGKVKADNTKLTDGSGQRQPKPQQP